MNNNPYSFDLLRSYLDENGNIIKVIRVTNLKYGISVISEGIHEHKVQRKGIKKIQQQIKEMERMTKK